MLVFVKYYSRSFVLACNKENHAHEHNEDSDPKKDAHYIAWDNPISLE